MSKSERSAEMSRIRRKGIKKPKRVARRSNNPIQAAPLNDEDRYGWILNDPSLYCWAQGEGVKL